MIRKTVLLVLFFLVVTPIHAVGVTVTDVPATLDKDQEFDVTVSLTCSGCSDSYLRGVFSQTESQYFGYTQKNDGSFVNSGGNSNYFLLTRDQLTNGSWTGKVRVKPDSSDREFTGPGAYSFKVGRASGSGSFSWSSPVSIQITGAVPTQTPTNTPMPTYTQTSTPTATPKSTSNPTPTVTSSPTPTKTPTKSPTSTPTKVPTPLPTTLSTPAPTAQPHQALQNLQSTVPTMAKDSNPFATVAGVMQTGEGNKENSKDSQSTPVHVINTNTNIIVAIGMSLGAIVGIVAAALGLRIWYIRKRVSEVEYDYKNHSFAP